jgi:nickel transport system permease protein
MVVVFALCNLAVDLVNAALDPRIRRHEGARS